MLIYMPPPPLMMLPLLLLMCQDCDGRKLYGTSAARVERSHQSDTLVCIIPQYCLCLYYRPYILRVLAITLYPNEPCLVAGVRNVADNDCTGPFPASWADTLVSLETL
jgi:hypothetical protein